MFNGGEKTSAVNGAFWVLVSSLLRIYIFRACFMAHYYPRMYHSSVPRGFLSCLSIFFQRDRYSVGTDPGATPRSFCEVRNAFAAGQFRGAVLHAGRESSS